MSNILLITTSLTGGGAERQIAYLSKYLHGNIFIAVFRKDVDKYDYSGEVINLDYHKGSPYLAHKIYNLIKVLLRLRRIKREYSIDTSISFMAVPNLLNILTKNSKTTIISERNYRSLRDKFVTLTVYKQIQLFLLTQLYNKATHIVAVSHAMANDLISNYRVRREKLHVIYNGCDIDNVKRLACEKIDSNIERIYKYPTIINVGKLTVQKGQVYLIRSFKLVKNEIPQAKLIILGEGDLREDLIKICDELDLKVYTTRAENLGNMENYDVFMFGYTKNPFKYIYRSNIFALPSLYEGFPNVIVEAMACGIPIVSADCKSGPREILSSNSNFEYAVTQPRENKYGYLMPVFSDQIGSVGGTPGGELDSMWSKILIRILSDKELQKSYMKNISMKLDKREFEIENQMILWNELVA